MRRLAPFVLVGLALAALSAGVGRGHLLQGAASLAAAGLGALLSVLGVLLLYRPVGPGSPSRRRVAASLALVFALQLLAIPLGWAVNAYDVARARAWCERVVDAARAEGRSPAPVGDPPALVVYDGPVTAGRTCLVTDRTSFMGWWAYDPATRGWAYVD
jgi:hypothetical protein